MREERLWRLTKLVNERESISVGQLLHDLNISYPTLRRDLNLLASRGVIKRVRGGVVAATGLQNGPNWFYKEESYPTHHLKVRIGQAAAQLVKMHQTIMLEHSTGTTLEVARALLRTVDITVITNSMEIAYLMKAFGKCRAVHLAGGTLYTDRYLAGPLTLSILQQFRVDIAFVGADGYSSTEGITDNSLEAAEIKRSMINSAQKPVLVADHTKVGVRKIVHCVPLSSINTLVTTHEIAQSEADAIAALGVNVIVC